jgi:hypothetical protein
VSRFLLVEMEEDLAARYTTHDGVFISCKCVNGVRSVTDLAMIDQVTLDAILRPPSSDLERIYGGKTGTGSRKRKEGPM